MSLVLINKIDHVATLTLNAPDQLNAMSEAMGHEFQNHLNDIKNDKDIRVVVITGAGRAFSSGGNLDMLMEKFVKTKEQNATDLKNFYKMFLSIRDLPQPVIAAINGHAVGAGFCLSLACDLRFASQEAKMGANFARIGLAPGMGGTYLITRLVGPTKAAEILLTGQIFKSDKIKQLGLVNGILESKDLIPHVQNVAKKIAANGPLSVQLIKKGIQQAMHSSLEEMFDYDSESQAQCFTTSDIKEGIEAVKSKRPPEFTGN